MQLFDVYKVSAIGDREILDLIVTEEHVSADAACSWVCETCWHSRLSLRALPHDPKRPTHFAQAAESCVN